MRPDGQIHRLAALLACLILCSCAPPPLTPPSGFQTEATTTRFQGATIITTDDDGHVTIVGNAASVDVGDAPWVTVVGNGLNTASDGAPQRVDQIGFFNWNQF